MSPEYKVNIPEGKTAEFEETVRNLGGKIETSEELRNRFLNELVIKLNPYDSKPSTRFLIPHFIVKHHSLNDRDALICELVEREMGGQAEQMNEKLIVTVSKVEDNGEIDYYGEFPDSEIEERLLQGCSWARIRIKEKLIPTGANKKLSSRSR